LRGRTSGMFAERRYGVNQTSTTLRAVDRAPVAARAVANVRRVLLGPDVRIFPIGGARPPGTGHRKSGPRSCKPSSTATPASPTPRSVTTRKPPSPSTCSATPSLGSPHGVSPSSGRCRTTGSAYRSSAWRDACHELGVTVKKTRPYRPQTFHCTLSDGWASGPSNSPGSGKTLAAVSAG
jgi:hypothetical protein